MSESFPSPRWAVHLQTIVTMMLYHDDFATCRTSIAHELMKPLRRLRVPCFPSPARLVGGRFELCHDARSRRARRFQRPVADACPLYERSSRQQLRPRGGFRRGCSWGLRLRQWSGKAKAVQGSSCDLRPATEGHVSRRRGVRPRPSSSHQRTNASKRQGILIRPECSSLRRRDAGDV